ncbi:MAG: DUF2155 domain-containing protein [Pseudomonadota bacterium]
MIPAALIGLALVMPMAALAQPTGNVAEADAAVVRALDRMSGELTEYEMAVGETITHGPLFVTLTQCRYPEDNPSGDAYGHLIIQDSRAEDPSFSGWMVASSPALNPLDHMRYDVWLIRCKTS